MARSKKRKEDHLPVGRPERIPTPAELTRVVNLIQNGAFDYVAAGAIGISRATWYKWMAQGRAGEPEFAEFFNKVMQARDDCRSRVEIMVMIQNPLAWLKYGPGRDRGPEDPGWTEGGTRVNITNQQATIINQDGERPDAAAIAAAERAYLDTLEGESSIKSGGDAALPDVQVPDGSGNGHVPAKGRKQGKADRDLHDRNGGDGG